MNCNLEEILRHFDVEFKPQAYGNGHINDTYIVQSTPRYILQRINTATIPLVTQKEMQLWSRLPMP